MRSDVPLRDVTEADLPIFFEQQLDPDGNHMAALTAKDPADRNAFMEHWTMILGDDSIAAKSILLEGHVVGYVASFDRLGKPEVTYWVGKENGVRHCYQGAFRVRAPLKASPCLCSCCQR